MFINDLIMIFFIYLIIVEFKKLSTALYLKNLCILRISDIIRYNVGIMYLHIE